MTSETKQLNLPRIDDDTFRILTTAIREHRRRRGDKDDKKRKTSEDSSTHQSSSRPYPDEDRSDIDEISDEDSYGRSSRHRSSSSDSQRDKEKYGRSSSSPYRDHSSSRSSKESTKRYSPTFSSERHGRERFDSPSPSSSTSSSQRMPCDFSESHYRGSPSSRACSTREEPRKRSGKTNKKKIQTSKSGLRKGSEKPTTLKKKTKQKNIKQIYLDKVNNEGDENVYAVEENCASEALEDSEAFQIGDPVEVDVKAQEEGAEFDEPFEVPDGVTEEQALSEEAASRSKRKRDVGDVCAKGFADSKLLKNTEFQKIYQLEDRAKSDSECSKRQTSSCRSMRSERQTRSEEKSPKRQDERTTIRSESGTQHEMSASTIEEDIAEVADAVEVEPNKEKRGKRCENEESHEVLDSIEDVSDKPDASTNDDAQHKAKNSKEKNEETKAAKPAVELEECSTDLEQKAFEILDSVEENAVLISEDLPGDEESPNVETSQEMSENQAKVENTNVENKTITFEEEAVHGKSSRKENGMSQSCQTPAHDSQDAKPDTAVTRSTRQTRSSSSQHSTPTKRGRTARETKESAKDSPKAEVVEEEPTSPPKAKRGRQKRQPKTALKTDEKTAEILGTDESKAEEPTQGKQEDSVIAMEVSEENLPKDIDSTKDKPVFEILDSLEEDPIANEQTRITDEPAVEKMDEIVSEDASMEDKPVEMPAEEATKQDLSCADDLLNQITIKDDLQLKKEVGVKPTEQSPSGFMESSETLPVQAVEVEQIRNVESQESQNKPASDSADLEGKELEEPSTRQTRSTRSGRVIVPKTQKGRRSRSKAKDEETPAEITESKPVDEKAAAEMEEPKSKDEKTAAEMPESTSNTLEKLDDNELCILDSAEDEKVEKEATQTQVKKRGRSRRSTRKSASKAKKVQPKSQALEESKVTNDEENQTTVVSEKLELEKSDLSFKEIDKTEVDDSIYEVVDETFVNSGTTDKELDETLVHKNSGDTEAPENEDSTEIADKVEMNKQILDVLVEIRKRKLDEKERAAAEQENADVPQMLDKTDSRDEDENARYDSGMQENQEKTLAQKETSQNPECEADLVDSVDKTKDPDNRTAAKIKYVDMSLDAVSNEEDFTDDALVVLDEITEKEEVEGEERIGRRVESAVEGEEPKAVAPELKLENKEQQNMTKDKAKLEGEEEEIKGEGEELVDKGEEQKTEGEGLVCEREELKDKEEELKEAVANTEETKLDCNDNKEEPKAKEEELVMEGEELNEESVQEPRPLAQEDQSGEQEIANKTQEETPSVEETPETDSSKSVKRKHEDDTAEDVSVVDEASTEEEQTPRGRGRGGKRGRKTPVRKSSRGRKVLKKDEELQESQTEPEESQVQTRLRTGEKEEEEEEPREDHQTQTEREKSQSLCLELGVETELRVGCKRLASLEGPESKRSRSQSPLVSSNTRLSPFRPNNPVGLDFVVPKSGFFCNLCSVFYLTETTARDQHCSSRRHYDNLKKHLQRESGLRSSSDEL